MGMGNKKAWEVQLHGNYQKGVHQKGASCLDGDTKARKDIHMIFSSSQTSNAYEALRVLEAF
jgi:hypothetical protein